MRFLFGAIVGLCVSACGDAAAPGADLAIDDVRDLAVADLGPSGCPPTFQPYTQCRGAGTICRYPTDAGPYDHLYCLGVWQPGNCPFGPGYATEFSGCIGPCMERFGEATTTCTCLPNGSGVCCIDTGGPRNCGNFDAGP